MKSDLVALSLRPRLATSILLVGLSGANLLFAGEFELPITFSPESRFFRGTSEKDTTLQQILQMLAHPESREVIGSHRMKTLRQIHPDWSSEQARISIDADLNFFRARGRLLTNLAACHSFMEDCPLPTVSTMMAVSFTAPVEAFPPHVPANSFGDYPQNTFRYKPYDPVISTSASRSEALVFVRGSDGYLLELADPSGKHCDQATRARSAAECLIWQTEYVEELEYPWFGYIAANELRALEQGHLRIERGSVPGHLKATRIDPRNHSDPDTLNRINQETGDSKRLKQVLSEIPFCSTSRASAEICLESN
jgi:hypothetical protein